MALAFALGQTPGNDVYITSRTPRDLPNFVELETVFQVPDVAEEDQDVSAILEI